MGRRQFAKPVRVYEDGQWFMDYTGGVSQGSQPTGGGGGTAPVYGPPPASGGGRGGSIGGGGNLQGWTQVNPNINSGNMYSQPRGDAKPQSPTGNLLKAGAIGAGAGAASIALGGLGSTAPLMAFGPAGIAAGAGLLALGLLGGKKQGRRDDQFVAGQPIKTGPSGNYYQAIGGSNTGGAIASAEEWTNLGRNYTGGEGGSRLQMGDYQNYVNLSQEALQRGDINRLNELRMMHGFNPFAKPAAGGGGGGRRKAAAAAVESAPSKPNREEVSAPASGLESTIKSPPKETVERPGLKPGLNKYMVPKSRKRRAGFFSFAANERR